MGFGVKAGITKLSELEIDADKDWGTKGISNIKEVAEGMDIGDIFEHDGTRLVKLLPGAANLVLTSAGPGKLLMWAPGGTYLNRVFPVSIYLTKEADLFSPDQAFAKDMPLASAYGIPDEVNPGWFRKLEPAVSLPKTAAIFTPDDSVSKDAAIASTYSTAVV